MGILLLLPLIGAYFFATIISGICCRKGGFWRMLGVLTSFAIGGFCVLYGYWFGIEGFTKWEGLTYRQVTYPVFGWIMMIGGGIIALLGTWISLTGTNEDIEVREELDRLEKEQKKLEETGNDTNHD